MPIIAQGLQKSYGSRTVVRGVDLELHRGEIVGLLGPNGAGKTTTFSLIVGLERPNSGTISFDGVDVTRMPMYRRARLGLGYLPQEPSVFRKLTVEDNLRAVLENRGISRAEQDQIVDQLLTEFNLDKVRNQLGAQLSGGERRRTEIARALALNPSFLFLDEPFAGVDPIAVSEIQEIVAGLRKRSLGIVITDHNVRETLRITDRAYIMHLGEILVSGTTEEISQNELARKYYLGSNFSL
ncbi:MAG: LPS export ABC transporter ATP-binding protein [Firmicutes bacterium]|mgnify:FL=1|jgi:lipopolysaccharide export system ATP-binding protein|nr:LPS export ABC transporter ATP-binding protein [Bacillota bacterium]